MKFKLSNDVSIDLEKLIETRLLVQANSGGGKSWAIRRIIEQTFGKVQIIVIDPEGEFSNMRSKFDFVYVGKGGDAPAESRSAALLAHRLLELKASAVIDLYELPPQERKHFVRLFCEALVNAPKELWHDALIIVDEAHVFAPEKSESESLSAIIDLASRGRKRGFCAVLATQRPAKLNKDAAAECNNKLIGRAALDIDRKRAAEELGFSTKESVLSLRNLDAGEFYVFGPAIGREVVRTTIGDVEVKPAKRGVARTAPPKPSAHVKKILAKLADLPQEAEQEARTVAELKAEIVKLKRTQHHNDSPQSKELAARVLKNAEYLNEQKIEKVLALRDKEWEKKFIAANAEIQRLGSIFKKIHALANGGAMPPVMQPPADRLKIVIPPYMDTKPYKPTPDSMPIQLARHTDQSATITIGKGEMAVLAAIASLPEGMTRDHITVQTGYKRSTRDAYIQRLAARAFVEIGATIRATPEGIAELGDDYRPLPTGQALREYHMQNLPEGEKKILYNVMAEYPQYVSREWLTQETEYKRSTRDAYIQRLQTRKLVETSREGVKASDFLFT